MKLRTGLIPNVNMQLRNSRRNLNICQMRSGLIRIQIKTKLYEFYDIDEYLIVKDVMKHKERTGFVDIDPNRAIDMIEHNHGFEVASTLARLICEIHYI